MEGKEVRFGISDSALWATTTTAASNGSVNSMHDSYTPLGGLVPMCADAARRGRRSAASARASTACSMFAIVAVFIAGLMVGRTPEFLGKKIEAFEMKMASLAILVPCRGRCCSAPRSRACVGTGAAPRRARQPRRRTASARSSTRSPRGANNNGSAFGGLTASRHVLRHGRSASACSSAATGSSIPVLAIAGSLARKKLGAAVRRARCRRTARCSSSLLVGTVLLVGALTFFPALALGPIVEHLQLSRSDRHDDVDAPCPSSDRKRRPLCSMAAIVRRAIGRRARQARSAPR